MIFYYIRHGDPIYDPDSLTELGHKQAEALSKRLALYGLDKIYCSTSTRAMQTAEPTCKRLNMGMTLLDWTNEGHTFSEMSVLREDGKRTWNFFVKDNIRKYNSPEVLALGDEWYKSPYFEKENFAKGIARINKETDDFFLSLGYKHDRKNHRYEALRANTDKVALFAHQGFGLSFISSLMDIPYNIFCTKFDFSHSSMTIIEFNEDDKGYVYPKMLQLSNDSHLYKEEILTGYNNSVLF